MKITFLDRSSFHENISIRQPSFEHQWQNFDNTTKHQVIERCKETDIVVTNKVVISRETLAACPQVKHIAVTATGYNIIDLDACLDHGVTVSNVPNYAETTVSEHVLNLSLSLCRQMNLYRELVQQGQWQSSPRFCLFDKPLYDLRGKVFGIIGFGTLGEAAGRLMHAVGMKVIYSSRNDKQSDFASYVSLSEVLEMSDVLSLHCALTPETHHLINSDALKAMKNSAFLINTARGGIADEQAVVDAVKANQLAGIGFDVLETEPPKQDSTPLLSIAHYPNVILTPHTAWSSQEAMQTLSDIVISNIEAFQKGKKENLVN